MAFVEFHDVGKTYHMGEVDINALHDTSFEIEKGELVVIVGPSGVHHHYITDTSVGEIRSGHLGYVFEYGAPGKNIKARHWVLKAVNQCRDNALDAAEAVFNDYLEQLHL